MPQALNTVQSRNDKVFKTLFFYGGYLEKIAALLSFGAGIPGLKTLSKVFDFFLFFVYYSQHANTLLVHSLSSRMVGKTSLSVHGPAGDGFAWNQKAAALKGRRTKKIASSSPKHTEYLRAYRVLPLR